MKKWKNLGKRGFSLMIALAMCASVLQTAAFAYEYDIEKGDVHVENNDDGDTVSWQDGHDTYKDKGSGFNHTKNEDKEVKITQGEDKDTSGSDKTATNHTVSVGEGVNKGKDDEEKVSITLDDVNIKNEKYDAAVSIGKDSDVTIELDGDNKVSSGKYKAGVSVGEGASVTIKDGDADGVGSLTAEGGNNAAGIGGDKFASSGNITIESGKIDAAGTYGAAGIGSGTNGTVQKIEINGGEVTAGSTDHDNPQYTGTGIGAGTGGHVDNITINGGDVTATGTSFGAGIGTGNDGATAGTINITGGTVNATGSNWAAGIGTGKNSNGNKGSVDEINISGGTVNAIGGDKAAGIGAGSAQYSGSSQVGSINISGGEVNASGTGASAGIGTSKVDYNGTSHVDSINISGGKVTASSNHASGAGIGTGSGSSVGNISISGGTVKATGGNNGAGIGAGTNGKVDSINISGGEVTSGVYSEFVNASGAGIGAGQNATVDAINISGGEVIANGGYQGAAIGAANQGIFGAIEITGGDIVATSGQFAAAIGNGYTVKGTGGTIAIKRGEGKELSLVALGDKYFAIDTRADVTGVEESILNGRFKEQMNSNGLTKAEEVTFVIVDAAGKTIKEFTLKPVSTRGMYESFAVNLPEGGTYYVFSKSENKYGGSIVGYEEDPGKQIAYVIEENQMLNADLMQFPNYTVSYKFESGTDGRDLPDSIANMQLEGSTGNKLIYANFLEMVKRGDSFSDVEVEDGTWSFSAWTEMRPVTEDGQEIRDVELVGSWTFTPAPPPPPPPPVTPPTPPTGGDDDDGPTGGGDDGGTTIIDGEVPLAGDLQLNREDHFAYIKGYEDGTVRPNNPLTRAQVATIFYRLLDEMSRTIYFSDTNDYSDVAADFWANKAISTLANAEIITGFADGTFRPNAYITRAQFAAIAARFDNVVEGLANPFTDVAEDYWARDLIAYAANKGWITSSNDKFRPLENITRVEAMDFINNVLERHVDAQGLLEGVTIWSDVKPSDAYYYVVLEATNSHDHQRRTKDQLMENWIALNEDPVWDE